MILIEDALSQHTEINEENLRMEMAATLYEHGPVSLRKAASIVGVDWMALQKKLGDKGISFYTEELLERDFTFANNFKK